MSNIGNNIKARRTALKMTQEELAAKMGYKSKSTINKIELGINDIPQSKIVKFAEVLQTTPKVLMGWEEVTEEMQKNSDIMVDITARIGSDLDFREIVKRNFSDDDYFELCKVLCKLNSSQIAGVNFKKPIDIPHNVW